MSIASRIESMTGHLTNDWNIIDSLGLHTKKLPKEYTQVDYIESHGTEYIDTGYKPNTNSEYELNFKIVNYTGTTIGFIFGGRISSSEQNTSFTANHITNEYNYLGRGDMFAEIDNNELQLNTEYLFQIKNNSFIVNGTTKDTTQNTLTETSTNNLYIFNINNNGSLSTGAKIKLKYFKTYENGQVVHYYIPCYRNSDNEVGLYDIVNNVFYTNQGTGVFTYGEIQEEHIDKNIENIKEPLDLFYNEVSDKTDLSQNGVVGRTSQETTTGKNLAIFEQPDTTISGLTIIYDNATGKISIKGKATATTGVRVSKQMQTNIPSGTYTLSINSALPVLINYVVADSQNNNTAYRVAAGSTSVTNTLSNNGVQASLFVAIENNVQYDLEFYMQLESGSTATDFEKFTYGASPNPDYPQPINNLSGDVAYKVSGKNKFNLEYEVETQYKTEGNVVSPKYILNNNQIEIVQSNVRYGRYFFNKLLLDVGTYTLSWIPSLSGTDKKMNYSVRNLDTLKDIVINTRIDIVDNEKYSITFTLTEKQYITFSLQPATNDGGTLTLKNIQLEEGSTATDFEPYIEPQTFDIPLTEITLPNFISGYVDYDGQIITPSTAFITTNDYIEVKHNTQYTFKANTSGTRCLIGEYDTNKEFILQRKEIVIGNTYTTVNNAKYIKFSVPTDSTNIEIYETSKPPIELCKIDTYEDKIYSSNGRFYLNKKIGKVVLNGSESWQTELYTYYLTDFNAKPYSAFSSTTPYAYANYFKWGNGSSGSFIEGCFWYTLDGSKLRVEKDNPLDLNSFKTWLSTHNTIVYYALATSTTTEITQENYPSLYNALKQIQDYLTAYKINKEFILGYSSPEIEY